MKRIVFVLCFLIVGIAGAYPNDYPPITPENVMNLREVEVLGTGAMNEAVAFAEDGKVVVGGTRGLFVYDNLQSEATFIELGINVQSLLFAGETLFFTDDTMLYAYDVVNQHLLYLRDGMKPLAVSHSGTMLAYEINDGMRVLDIVSGEILYDLEYESLPEPNSEEGDDWFADTRFVSAQFLADDSQILVYWSFFYAGGWEARSWEGMDIWTLESDSHEPEDLYPSHRRDSWFLGFDAEDNPIYVVEEELENLGESEFTYLSDFEPYFIVAGNYFAAPYNYGERGQDRVPSTGIWDWRTGEEVARFPLQGALEFNQDASRIAIDRHIFDIASGQEIAALEGETYDLFGENVLQYRSDGSIRLLNSDTYEEITVLPIQQRDLAMRDGEVFILNNAQEAYWIDPKTGATRAHFVSDEPIIRKYTDWDFNDSGTFALSYDYSYEEAYLWSVETGQVALPRGYSILNQFFYEGSGVLIHSPEEGVAMYNPDDGSFFWTFERFACDCSYEPGSIEFSDEYLVYYGRDDVTFFSMETEEEVLVVPNPYGETRYFAWAFDMAAYFDVTEIVVVSLPEGEEIQRIQPEAFGWLLFEDSETIWLIDEVSYEDRFFDIATGAEIPDPRPASIGIRFAETENLHFYHDFQLIRIADNADVLLREIDPENFEDIILSSDGSRLLLDYYDGTIRVWAVGE